MEQIETASKVIELCDTHVIIDHNITSEFTNCGYVGDDETVLSFYHKILGSYALAEKLNYCKVLSSKYNNLSEYFEEDDELIEEYEATIKIKMERYDTLSKKIINMDEDTFYKNMRQLLRIMKKKNIVHTNLTLDNIGVDENGSFWLLELDSIEETTDLERYANMMNFDFPKKITWADAVMKKLESYLITERNN